MSKPSRLYRILKPSGTLFEAQSAKDTFDDDRLKSITVTRGDDNNIDGLKPSTLEMDIAGQVNTRVTGQTIRLLMNRDTWEPILSRLGLGVSIGAIEHRFIGRTGPLSFNDHAPGRGSSTTIQCGSWISYENRTGRRRWYAQGMRVYNALAGTLGNINKTYGFGMSGEIGNTGKKLDGVDFQSVWGDLANSVRLPVFIRRNGHVQAVSLPYLENETNDRTLTAPHLLRSQVLEPAGWDQPNEVSASKYQVTRAQQSGNPITQEFDNQSGVSHDYDLETVDWSALHPVGDHWIKAIEGFMARRSTRRWVLRSLRVDLLHLMTSHNRYDRTVAGFLLTLETGESINIAGDWPTEVQGAYIVCGSNESITPDGWEIELSLLPYVWAFGSPSPTVPAYTWDAATPEWNQPTTTWEQPV